MKAGRRPSTLLPSVGNVDPCMLGTPQFGNDTYVHETLYVHINVGRQLREHQPIRTRKLNETLSVIPLDPNLTLTNYPN